MPIHIPSTEHTTQEAEKNNIITCLSFLISEARKTQLNGVADIIAEAIDEIRNMEPLVHEDHDIEKNIIDLLEAFKLFVRFYLLEDVSIKKLFFNRINEMDKEELKSYVQ